MFPLISIIVPTFNAVSTLDACLKSIVQQTYLKKEVLIIDGASSDDTLLLAKKYSDSYPFIRCISEKDKGVYDAMNKGIDLATGDYLFFLGSDDQFYSATVLHEIFSDPKNTSYGFLYGNVFFKHAKNIYSGESSVEKLIGQQISICHQAIFYRKTIFEKIGKYNTHYFVHADYDLNVRCFEHPDIKIKYIDTIVTVYNEEGISGLQANKDGFHDQLTLHYLSTYTSPFQLILKIKKLEHELQSMKQSRTYRLFNRFSGLLRKVRRILNVGPVTKGK